MAIWLNIIILISCHQLQLQLVNQPLAVEGNYTAAVHSLEPAEDNPSDIVITIATNSSAPPATLTDQLTQPLEHMLEEVTDINEQIAFTIATTERHGKYVLSRVGDVGAVYVTPQYGECDSHV